MQLPRSHRPHATRKYRQAPLATAQAILLLLAGAANARAEEDPTALGGMAGLRPALATIGASLSASTTIDAARNPSGGAAQGQGVTALTSLGLDIDGGTAFGLDGVTLHASALLIAGQGFSTHYTGVLNTLSSIEAAPAARLFELYLDAPLGQSGLDLRLGQLSLDQEFITTETSAVLVNASFGWPTLTAADLVSGGAAYPLATPAIRLAWTPAPNWTLRAALANANPAPDGEDDPQRLNRSGTNFRLDGGSFAIAELQADGPACLAGEGASAHCKLGVWYENAPFADLRYDAQGGSLADPASSQAPRRIWSNYGVYASVERDLLSLPGSGRGISGLLRATVAPGDRNLISFAANAALVMNGPFAARPDDRAALGFAWAKISPAARGLAADMRAFAADPVITRSDEYTLEATYQAAITPWLSLQPDLQYVINPGGGIARLDDPAARAGNALVMLMRAAIIF